MPCCPKAGVLHPRTPAEYFRQDEWNTDER